MIETSFKGALFLKVPSEVLTIKLAGASLQLEHQESVKPSCSGLGLHSGLELGCLSLGCSLSEHLGHLCKLGGLLHSQVQHDLL